MSLRLSRKGDYGLLLVTALALRRAQGKLVSLKEVAREKKLPYKFLSQVAGELHKAGILESKEGVGGGYRLAKEPEKILVREVLDAVEGPMEASECEHECDCGGACVHEQVEEKIMAGAPPALAKVSIKELAQEART